MSEPITAEEARRLEDLYGPLTNSVRTLIDSAIRSQADESDVLQAHSLIDQAVRLLSSRLDPEPFGVRSTTEGGILTWGNVAMGVRNAIAFPLNITHDENGRASADLLLASAYEGPPDHVHGGVCALILDHVLGATAHRPGRPALTGTLNLRYVAPTPLGKVRAEAWVESETESKTIAVGELRDSRGALTVQAEGIFIRPKAKV
ncbi:PaaI family thioesterase [Mycolicibacterium bacteremicum]|uniref:Acyl-coenzyme A thioesterase THEM4 n=1 Tax=Mycolicibacterium bacteremicum TaxID=564198 RepID=A0A1W9YNW5_MYCBA|nr:PaaI family thioesterase [Mycolicibacterium bacteremicum]MCV7433602.1 PaaI family thioesterase [Mycolicibacterium bacteremicum]ORA01699.1 thioesterase [Mycolicibacterium bacteremicum]